MVWSLCAPSNSTVEQIIYQYASLYPEISAGTAQRNVLSAIDYFRAQSLITFAQLDAINYPLDVSSFSHFYTSRGGLYAINKQGFLRLAYGMFFGITADDSGNLLVFDFPHKTTPLWRHSFSQAKQSATKAGIIRRFKLANGKVHKPEDYCAPVANNTHYLVLKDKELWGVDTEAQSIYRVGNDDGRSSSQPSSLLQETPILDQKEYHHINSLAPTSNGWIVMKCIESTDNNQSSVAVLDQSFKLIKSISIEGQRAHDLLNVEVKNGDESFWYCDSLNNHIRHHPSGDSVRIDRLWGEQLSVRGLSQTKQEWVVGSGAYGRYYDYIAWARMLGRVHFINKQNNKLRHVVEVPEIPCCIISNPSFVGASLADG